MWGIYAYWAQSSVCLGVLPHRLCCADDDDAAFWAHEYNAHGTCNINDLDEFEYFNDTLKLNDKFSIDVSWHNSLL